MECNFYDKNLNKIGALSSFVSMTWEEGYSDMGSFSIVADKDEDTLKWIRVGNFAKAAPHKTMMWIYTVEDKDGKLWGYGAEAKWLLNSRIYDGTAICENVEVSLKNAITEKRPYPIIGVSENKGLDANFPSKRQYNTLFELAKAWCDRAGYGFTLLHDKVNKKLLFDIYEGRENPNAVFAEKYGNLYNFVRTQSQKQWANVAFVAGAGEGDDRKIVVVGDTNAEDFERSEIFVDARDLQPEEGQSESDYIKLLESRGYEKLNNAQKINEIDFDVSADDYGKRYAVGDILTVIFSDKEKAFIRAIGVRFIYENNQKKVSLILGNPVFKSEV